MNDSPRFTASEAGGAQLQALNTLVNCGWRYVTRAEADLWRDGLLATLPGDPLRADLARINRITLDGRSYPFSEANIDTAVRRLANRIPEGVVRANERMTDDLMLGIALPQTIGATSREWPFKFIDWSDWRANTFQVTSEYSVSEPGGNTIRVDLALFVNGLPWANTRSKPRTWRPTRASASKSAIKKPGRACRRSSTARTPGGGECP